MHVSFSRCPNRSSLLCGVIHVGRPEPDLWRLTFTDDGLRVFVQSHWLQQLGTSSADPGNRWARLYRVSLQAGTITDQASGVALYTMERV